MKSGTVRRWNHVKGYQYISSVMLTEAVNRVCTRCHIQTYTIVYMQAKQKLLHRKKNSRELTGILNMPVSSSLSSRRAAKRIFNGEMNKKTLYQNSTCLQKIFMGGIFLQYCWDQMCSRIRPASRMSRTPSLLLVALVSLSAPEMQRWWRLVCPGPG